MFAAPIFGLSQQPLQFRKEDTMYKTANTLPEKIRSKSVAALMAGLVGLTALSMTPLTASAGTTGVTAEQVKHIVTKYLAAHPYPEQRFGRVHGIYVGDSEHQKP
jgi:hypothetical protein